MKHLAIPTALAFALALAGCASLDGFGGKGSAPLAYAPADSAIVFGNLASPPKDYAALNTLWFNQLRTGLVQSLQRMQELSAEASDDANTQKRADALLTLLEQKLSQPEGWAAIGIDVNARMAIYEVNALPVLRLELSDAKKFETFLTEAEQRAEVPFGKTEVGGQTFWHTITDKDPEAIVSPRFVAALVGSHLVLTVDVQREDTPLVAQLGLTKPASSVVDTGAIEALNKQYGFQPGMASGYIDLKRVLAQLANPEQKRPWVASVLSDADINIDSTCQAELETVVAKAPRLVGGGTELSLPAIKVNVVWELEAGLAKELSALPAPVQGLDSTQRGNMVIGAGLNLSNAAGFLQKQAGAIVAQPYQCELLEPLNEIASELNTSVAGLYAVSSWVQGFRLNFSKLDLRGEDFEGTLQVATPNPAGLIGMAQSFVPELAQLGLVPGGEAKQLDASTSIAALGQERPVWAIMGDAALAVGLGEGAKAALEQGIKAAVPAVPPLMYFGFSGDALVNMMGAITEEELIASSSSQWEEDYNYVMWPLTASSIELYKQFEYTDMQWLTTARGLEFPQTIIMKPQATKAP